MRTLERIKLNQFSKDELDQRKLNALKGGCNCRYSCSCISCCGSLGYVSPEMALGCTVSPRENNYVHSY